MIPYFSRVCLSFIFAVNLSLQFASADAKYMTEWTNPDGTKSKAPATFYSLKEAKTQNTPKLLSWECGMTELVKWVNWEIDFEKNVMTSWWQNHDSSDYKPYAVYKILSAKDGSITVQDYLRDGEKIDKDKVVIWEFYYQSDPSPTSNLYSIWKGNRQDFKYCKNTTSNDVPQTSSMLAWECGSSEYFQWINWEIDFEKNELRSKWLNKDSDNERAQVARINSKSDRAIFVQDYLEEQKKWNPESWEFNYQSDQLYTIYLGDKYNYGDCKNTTPVQAASMATQVTRQIGHYAENKRNRLVGSYSNGGASFEGYWVQDAGGQECNSIVDGSRYYGRVFFKMVRAGEIEGRWGYCDVAPIYAWNGKQIPVSTDVPKVLSSKQQRIKVQKSLNFFGFKAGSPDGVFGKKTRSAVGDLQACWSSLDPSGGTLPGSTEFGVLTPKQTQFLMDSYDKAKQEYSKANCFYFQTLL